MLKQGNKIVIVGAGQVGATTAYTLLISGLVSELVLIDLNEQKVLGEVLDLAHGIPLCPPANIKAGGYADCAHADIVIFAAGANQRPGETRMDLTRKNAAVFAQIVPRVMEHAPKDVILLVVTNPVDVLTYETQQLSGLNPGQVIGSGTVLDTSRLRYLLSQHTGVDARNIHSYVLGEHGDSELPAFSLTNIAGVSMDEYCAVCGGCEGGLSKRIAEEFDGKVRKAAYAIIEGKGATYYAVALAVRRIVEAILRDEKSILTVSSLMRGEYGLNGVCLSLPSIVGAKGVENVLAVPLSEEELRLLRASAGEIRQGIESSCLK
ncbi:MAG: L-lactate dehydrogenase [Christensenellaceae bacterium]|jgi:L-lactate dehydrogenase|nr:L-lactate dehydrogenase [Christensenellaceae bacterium]